MSDRIDEGVVLLVQTYLTNQESRVDDQSEDNYEKEDDAENKQSDLAPVEYDPADVKRDCQSYQRGAKGHEEGYRFSTTSDSHGALL